MVHIRVLKTAKNNSILEIIGTWPLSQGESDALDIKNEKGEKIGYTTFPIIHEKTGKTAFRACLDMHGGARYAFYLNGKKNKIKFGRHSRLLELEDSFVEAGDFIVKRIKNEIRVYTATWKMRMACRYRFAKVLKSEGKGYLIPIRKKALAAKKKKPVAILSDRVNMGGDNAEALFKYLMANGYDKDYDIYFAVHKDTEDYERISKIGKVLGFGTDEHKEKFLISDMIITAGFDNWFTNIFDEDGNYMRDLYGFQYYFLQHGVTMNDWSKGLNAAVRNVHRFFTVNKNERDLILQDRFGYTEEEVPLTGFARYDLLEDEAEKLIVIAPSWRYQLAGPIDRERGSRFYSEKIKGSDYHEFYNGLINNEKLLSVMKEKGYRGEFYLHPSFIQNDIDFDGNDIIQVYKKADYNRIFRKAAVLVTDYSSVNIDFAYLDKPVVYSQYDKDTFFDEHLCEQGYFDYERDGFGPVCVSIDETADAIISFIENDCRNEEKYSQRANEFFAYRDKDNSKRIADVIFNEERE